MNKSKNFDIEEYLEKLDLSQPEIRLYLELVKTGESTVLELAKHLEVNRSTAYLHMEELIRKGLIIENKKGSRRTLFPESPEKIKFLIEDKRNELKALEEQLPDFIKNIINTTPDKEDVNSVTYHRGKNSVRALYREVVKAKKLYSFVNVDHVFSIFPENSDLFKNALYNDNEVEMWEIVEDSRPSREYIGLLNERYYFKVVPETVTFGDNDFMIYDDKVAIVQLDYKEPTGVAINSKAMAKGFKAIHKLLWDMLPYPSNFKSKRFPY